MASGSNSDRVTIQDVSEEKGGIVGAVKQVNSALKKYW